MRLGMDTINVLKYVMLPYFSVYKSNQCIVLNDFNQSPLLKFHLFKCIRQSSKIVVQCFNVQRCRTSLSDNLL